MQDLPDDASIEAPQKTLPIQTTVELTPEPEVPVSIIMKVEDEPILSLEGEENKVEVTLPAASTSVVSAPVVSTAVPEITVTTLKETIAEETVEEAVVVMTEEPVDHTSELQLTTEEKAAPVPSVPVVSTTSSPEKPRVPAAPSFTASTVIQEEKPTETQNSPRVPAAPTFFSSGRVLEEDIVSEDSPRVPAAPTLFVSSSIIEEEVEYNYNPWDDDFWSDFFIVGEDELSLLDGTYYMDLFINGIEYGEIEVVISGGLRYVNTVQLESYLDGKLKDEAHSRIFAGEPDYLTDLELKDRGVDTEIDTSAFHVRMTISTADMTWQTISLASTNGHVYSKPIVGALKPLATNFSIVSRLSDSLSFSNSGYGPRLTNSLSVNSTAIFYQKLNLDFNFSLRTISNHTDYNWGSFRFYMFFPEKMTKVSWGNVGTSLLSPSGRSLGISIEKNFAFSKNGTKKSNVHASTLILEKESLVEVENNGRVFYSKVLAPGNYNLQDFSLISGVNRIMIRVKPLDGSEIEEYSYSFAYAASLLAPGEFYYSAALATGYEVENNAFRYKKGNLALSGSLQYGWNKSTTISLSAAMANKDLQESLVPQIKITSEVDHANYLGVARYNLNLNFMNLENGIVTPEVYARAGEQVSFESNALSYLTAAIAYQSPERILSLSDRHSLQISLGVGGSLAKLGWSMGGSLSAYSDSIGESHFSSYLTLGANPFDNFSISLSLNVTGTVSGASSITGRVLGSYTYGGSSASASIDEESTRVSLSTPLGKASLGGTITAPGYRGYDRTFFDKIRYNANLTMSEDFGLFSVAGGINTSIDEQSYSGTVTASTNLAYAAGAIGIGTSINQNFLVIKETGSLSKNDVYAGYSGSTEFKKLPRFFGSTLYSGFSQVTDTSLVLYSEPRRNGGMNAMFPVIVSGDAIGASVITLETEDIYSVSGIAKAYNGHLFANSSSPLYTATSEDGVITLEETEDYIFTDENGRFIFDDLKEGSYGFDAEDERGKWTLFLFDIEKDVYAPGFINLVETSKEESSLIAPEEYDSVVELTFQKALSTDGYWDMLYPGLGAAL
ncbi:MAG: fimbria/pilus outer membrane usher protein [Spirochaetales bacterium]|nr:fimbria/pilus outer membrane usher protein [Candidatus Physcosoma equi]